MTLDLKYKHYVLNKLVSDLKGFVVYYNPQFKSWWWIKPETKEWRFEFKKTGSLYWYYGWGDNFKMKYSLDDSEFEEIISRYVEHTLQNGVIDTKIRNLKDKAIVEDTLQNGVIDTRRLRITYGTYIEHTLQNGIVGTLECRQPYKRFVEDMISKESECTFNVNYTIKHGSENEPR